MRVLRKLSATLPQPKLNLQVVHCTSGVARHLVKKRQRGQRALTRHLSETADEEGLVVGHVERDAVAQCLLLVVFDVMLCISISHTQQVLLQQLGAAQDGAIIRKGGHKPVGSQLSNK